MTMKLHLELRLRTHHLSPSDVLGGMGYSSVDTTALAHYQAISESPYLGLERAYRDERFDERDFLKALCRCVGLKESDYLPAINAELQRLTEDQAAYRHWLFADTDYVRGPGTPIFAMAFTERLRRLRFPIGFWRLPWEERMDAASQKASDHMRESGGQLVIWGKIKRYHYCYAEGRSIVISPNGKVIGERSNFDPPKATCRLKGSNEDLGDLFDSGED